MKQANDNNIVYTCQAKYSLLVWILLATGPLSIVLSVVLVLMDSSATESDRNMGLAVLAWSSLALILLYSAVLPRRFNVHQNGSVSIVVFLCTWSFADVDRAFQSQTMREGMFRMRMKFATDLDSRVVICRKHGKWDLVLSPEDPQGLVQAVNETVMEAEQGPIEYY